VSKNLIIVESPTKIKSYKKVLGKEYEILASFGHCVDLPPKKLSVNIKKDFEPTFAVIDDKEDIVKNIKTHAKKASDIYLMTDPDREGEAIATHIYDQIKSLTKAKIYRATTSEITNSGIKAAIENAGKLNEGMFNSYLCRRILDRIVGWKTSYLTKQATGGRSAGRVQSAVLRILAEREKEIQDFVPEEYWVLTAHFKSSKGYPYTGVLDTKIKVSNEKKATEIYDEVVNGSPIIELIESKLVNSNPYAPFVTSSMIQTSSSMFGWTGKKTMKTAQSLYEGGLITYIRTDSSAIAVEAMENIRNYISDNFENKYLPKTAKIYGSKKGAQEGHECCRPTDISVMPHNSGGNDEQKLYRMIWKRVVSSQMTPGKDKQTRVTTKVSKYNFISNGKIRIFDGYRAVWDYSSSKDAILPDLTEGEKCTLLQLDKDQKFTTPPSRFNDGSIVKKCESLQIGRPSTYQQCIETLINRKYAERQKKAFHATKLGMDVVDFLKSAHFCFVDLAFTANMEQLLDEIASGKKQRVDVLKEFWDRLKTDIESGKQVKNKKQITEFKCPKCGGSLLKKHSSYGPFFSCENYKSAKSKDKDKSCSYLATVDDHGQPVEKVVKPKEYADFKCKKCKSKMVKRSSTWGEFYGCENFPSCRMTADMEGIFKTPKKKKYYKKADT
jgi:DNA topoisomerase I